MLKRTDRHHSGHTRSGLNLILLHEHASSTLNKHHCVCLVESNSHLKFLVY